MKPPRYLKAGDRMRLRIEKLGEQQQSVIGYHPVDGR
jgi:2-keto-4-pentenoate hydratase/2-oxohepta-3-ene-1,7-dioic acid hydratase in catechol pathway